jgi:hypothetical protein
MRIHRLALRNYRAIREYRLELPASGVVVIEGENEIGKSSIAEALWLVFEVPDSSDSERVRSIKPVDRDAATEIELEVSSGPYRFTYSKRFHRAPRTELRVEARGGGGRPAPAPPPPGGGGGGPPNPPPPRGGGGGGGPGGGRSTRPASPTTGQRRS